MTPQELRALEVISASTDAAKLRQIAANARGRSSAVEQAALRRLAAVSSTYTEGTIEHECWAMIAAVEELRRIAGRKVWRMNRLRPKIEAEGEIAALDYCARNETEGFAEVIGYGMTELTAEAIVLRYPDYFQSPTKDAARARLSSAGFVVDAAGDVVASP